MQNQLHPDATYTRTVKFTDEDGEYFDPTSITVTFFDSRRIQSGDSITLDASDKEDTGIYILAWNVPSDADSGQWACNVKAECGESVSIQEWKFSVYTMPYGDFSKIRTLCSLDSDETAFDGRLQDCLDMMATQINDELSEVATTPLTSVPDIIHTVANLLTAGLYLQSNAPDEKEHNYTVRAEKMLDRYVIRQRRLSSELPIVIGKDIL